MLVLAVLFLFTLRDKVLISDEGIYGDSEFVEWDSVKKWYTDKEEGQVVILFKEGFNEQSKVIRINSEEADVVDSKFRKYVLGKE